MIALQFICTIISAHMTPVTSRSYAAQRAVAWSCGVSAVSQWVQPVSQLYWSWRQNLQIRQKLFLI